MYNKEAVTHDYFGFDSDVLTIDRGEDLLSWNAKAISPSGQLTGPTCGMHWPNLIHPDPDRNSEMVKEWVDILSPYQEKEDTMLASDSSSFQSQLLYQGGTKVIITKNSIHFDFTELNKFPSHPLKNELTIKTKAEKALKFKSNDLEIESISFKNNGEIQLHTLKIEGIKRTYKASIDICI